MEFLILSALSFDLTFPTSYRFLERYNRILGDDPHVMSLALFLMELALIDVRMLQYPFSVVAGAALCQAYKSVTRKLHPEAPADCEKRVEMFVRENLGFNKDSGTIETLLLCCKELHFLKLRSMNSSLQAVRKKYQGPEFSAIHAYIFQ